MEETEELEEDEVQGTPVEYEELDISEIESKEGFSKHTHAGKGGSWDSSKIQEVIRKLHESEDSSKVFSIPVSWIWENLRTSQNIIKYSGYFARKVLIDEAEVLGMPIIAKSMGCSNSTLNGQIEIRFK